MKKLLYLVILFLITSIISTAFSQQNSTPYIKKQSKKTNLDITYSTSDWNGQIGGYMLPSIGTINTLIIFSQFPDDKYDTNNVMWPKGKDPLDKNDWINQTWTSNPIPGSLTHYFNDMSFNKFKFIGKTVSVISPHTRKWYLDNNWKRGDIQKEIILQINKTMNFAEFDNWKSGIYKQLNEPDGYIDLIIFILRNLK